MATPTLVKAVEAARPAETLPAELPATALRRPCDPDSLGFATTVELPDLQEVIGQPRAFKALELGSEVVSTGYNIFVLGLPDSGRTTLSQEYLHRKAAGLPRPDDWCYVNNFDNPYAPKALRLPAGQGTEFRKDMAEFIAQCGRELPKAFESPEYTGERERMLAEMKKTQDEEFERLQGAVGQFQFLLARTPAGVLLTPGKEGRPLGMEDFDQMSPEERQKYEQLATQLGQDVERTLSKLREMGRAADLKMDELNQRTARAVIEPLIGRLQEAYAPVSGGPRAEAMLAYLEAVQEDLYANAARFQAPAAAEPAQPIPEPKWTQRYAVNVLVDNSAGQGAPVVLESHPAYQNIVGRIEHEVVMGGTRTDFTMIRPGALHRANGGYLILPARDLLLNPYAWEGLKRVLRDGAIRIIELANQLGLVSTQTLDPEPIPLEAKILLIGTPMLYYLLRLHDEDFAKLFKVKAEFATTMDRTPETEREYGLYIKSVLEDKRLPPFDSTAVARVIEHSARLAEDQHKLSTRFGQIADLVCEAAYWARKDGQAVVGAPAVQRAIEEGIYRNNLFEERLQEMIAEGTLLIDTHGAASGQINALAVLTLGDYAFGRPTRLTASVYPGQGGIVDIERQAELSGPIHTKGVLILAGFLGWRYGGSRPISLTASLTFEQSYDEVEGDSASVAELLALLSALAQIPLRQDCAVTGSVNQRGQVQAIGGVNEKIEGFFDVCRARGLTGSQGVLIPGANQRNLMLRADVTAAVAAGQFHIWPVESIDECLALLTGCEPGELRPEGGFPEGTFNQAVYARLDALHAAAGASKGDGPASGEAEARGG